MRLKPAKRIRIYDSRTFERIKHIKRRIQKAERDERADIGTLLSEAKEYMSGFTKPRMLRVSNWWPGGAYIDKEKKFELPLEEAYTPHTVFVLQSRYQIKPGVGRAPVLETVTAVCNAASLRRVLHAYNSASMPEMGVEIADNAHWPWRLSKAVNNVTWLDDLLTQNPGPSHERESKTLDDEEDENHVDNSQSKAPINIGVPEYRPPLILQHLDLTADQRVAAEKKAKYKNRRRYLKWLDDNPETPFWRPVIAVTFPTRPIAMAVSRLSLALPRGRPYHAVLENIDRKYWLTITNRILSMRIQRILSLSHAVFMRLAGYFGGLIGARFSAHERGRGAVDDPSLWDSPKPETRGIRLQFGAWHPRAKEWADWARVELDDPTTVQLDMIDELGFCLDENGERVPGQPSVQEIAESARRDRKNLVLEEDTEDADADEDDEDDAVDEFEGEEPSRATMLAVARRLSHPPRNRTWID